MFLKILIDNFEQTNSKSMAAEIITKEDLEQFGLHLLEEIKKVILERPNLTRQWLKSADVRKLLQISPGTLQNMRINGTLRYSKVGGIIYYSSDDIQKLLIDTSR